MSKRLSRTPVAIALIMLSSPGMAAEQEGSPPVSSPGTVTMPGYPAPAYPQPAPTTGGSQWNQVQRQIGAADAQDAQISAAFYTWRRLSQSDSWPFGEYANFLVSNPGWPDAQRMRKVAEARIDPNSYDAGQVVRYFNVLPPLSATGHARYAAALSATGRLSEAKAEARLAWIGGAAGPNDEAQLLSLYGSSLRAEDHDLRADTLLWAKNTSGAERVLAYTSPGRQPVFAARIALQRRAPDATMKVAAAEGVGRADAGFVGDRAMWLRDTGQSLIARQMLSNRPPLTYRPANAEKWFEVLLTIARQAAADGQSSVAYGIASKIDDAYPQGTDVSGQPLGERDDYTSLAWLAGNAAFYNLGRPRDAEAMYVKYAQGAKSPSTVSKGYYWAGRAALKGGDPARANAYFTRASAYPDQFYGQLSLERLGRPVPSPSEVGRSVEISASQREAFNNRSMVRAIRYLGRQGQWKDQTLFLRALAASTDTDLDRVLTTDLARSVNRPDLGVMVGRRATAEGLTNYSEGSFPKLSVPSGHQFNWTMIHAITRQESQFDKAAVSHAGARGLMQLMPGTARETAGRVGLSYNLSSLTEDTGYNMQLGSTYFTKMLEYYGGSYPLAVAAYNAGPGNVNKWIAANGDPRLPGADMLKWIEDIPIFETKNYVQRVLENAVVYDVINPSAARYAGPARLSRYLGKNQPG